MPVFSTIVIGATFSPFPAYVVITPPAIPSQQWKLDGKVNALATDSNGHVYIGGEFTGMTWEIDGPLASMDSGGRRRVAIPPTNAASMHIVKIAVADNGYIYVAGRFAFTMNGVTIKNLARILPNGQWDLSFRPNPVDTTSTDGGTVAAIAIEEIQLVGGGRFHAWVSIGGGFLNRLQHETNDEQKNRRIYCFARIPRDDNPDPALSYFSGIGKTDNVNNIRVSDEPIPTASLPSLEIGGVNALDFVETLRGPRLVIGGAFRSIRFGKFNDERDQRAVQHLAVVALDDPLSSATFPRHVAANAPRVFWPVSPTQDQAVIRDVKIAGPNMNFGDAADTNPERALVFSGQFTRVEFRHGHAQEQTVDCDHLCLSTLSGHMPDPNFLPVSGTTAFMIVDSIAIDQANRVWANYNASGEIMRVYQISNNGGVGRLTPYTDFNVPPNGPIHELVFDPDENVVVAVGDFTTRPASREYTGTTPPTLFQRTIPANHITAYSTTKAPDGAVWSGFGDHVPKFRVSLPARLWTIGAGAHGYVVGTSYSPTNPLVPWSLKVERTNLAAIDAAFRIQDWGPLTDGPVYALAVDTSAFPEEIAYYGGQCHSWGLPDTGWPVSFDTNNKVMAAVAVKSQPFNDDYYPVDWYTYAVTPLLTPYTEPRVNALAIGDSVIALGGVFTDVAGTARDSVAAVETYSPPTVTGLQSPIINWIPNPYKGSAFPSVNAIVIHGGHTYLGGDFEGTQSTPTLHGLVRCDEPSVAGNGLIDTNFDVGLNAGNVVHALTIDATTANLYAAGDLGTLSPGRRMAAAWIISTQAHLFDCIMDSTSGAVARSVAIANGKVVIGGSFAEVWSGTVWLTRKGAAAFDKANGSVLSWQPDPIAAPPTDSINAVLDSPSIGKVWLGGYQPSATFSGFIGRTNYP